MPMMMMHVGDADWAFDLSRDRVCQWWRNFWYICFSYCK